MGSVALSTLALLLSSPSPVQGDAIPSALAAVASACPAVTNVSTTSAQERDALRCGVGVVRRTFRLSPLKASPALDRSSLLKADAIRRCGFSHTPCRASFTRTFQQAGYLRHSSVVGENLAWAQGDLGSPLKILEAWLASPPHRENLLSRRWRDVGIGFERGHMFGMDTVSLWVLEFGRRR